MKMEMTERDKRLLIFLALFVIVVCIGYWGIYPVIKDIQDIKADIIEEQDEKEINELKIMQVPMLEVDNERLEQDILDTRKTYYPIMTSDQIDKYFTGIVLDYGLYSYDLGIDIDESETKLSPYQFSNKALGISSEDEEEIEEKDYQSADDYLEDDEDSEDESFEAEEINTGLYSARVSLRLGGEESKLMKLINDYSTPTEKLRIVGYSWGEERSLDEQDDGEYKIQITKILTITMEIYMCEE